MNMANKITIMGHTVDVDRIGNPRLRTVIRERRIGFLFSYGDAGTYKEGRDHSDHTDKTEYGDYSERSTHLDDTAGSKYNIHTDRTRHTDEPYDDVYRDYSNAY